MNWDGQLVEAIDLRGASTQLRLGKRLGQPGAEGTVYRVQEPASPARVVKIFHEQKRASKAPKVRAMLELDPEPNVRERRIAWPVAVAHSNGAAVGYVMPLMGGTEMLDATNPRLRQDLTANLDLFSFYWLAENLAKTIASLHVKGHVVGDLKDTNARFNTETLELYLIDTDSFGIATRDPKLRNPDATTPDWSPPEWRPDTVPGIPHDLFSLAVFYHWLLFAVHPFSGPPKKGAVEDSIVDAIRAGRWLYGDRPMPNKTDPPLYVVSPGLQTLFRRAFQDGHSDPAKRPPATDWQAAFAEGRYDLKWCDKRELHVFDAHARQCPWCSLKPERWATTHRATSRTKDIARKELANLATALPPSMENLDRVARRLAANPSFGKSMPEVVKRVEAYRQHQDAIDRALGKLRQAARDDLKLIKAAQDLRRDPELVRLARTTADLSGLLDRADALEGCLQRLQADVAAAAPDPSGRFALDRERRLIQSFQRETTILESSDGLRAQFAQRRAAAHGRLDAADSLSAALTGAASAGSPIQYLADVLKQNERILAEIADEDIAGPAGKAALARHIVELGEKLALPAASFSDKQIDEYWNRHIAPAAHSAAILDAALAADKPSLRAAVEEARRSCAEIEKFEQLLRSAGPPSRDAPDRDRVIVAADPTARLWARARVAFEQSPAFQSLSDAQRRVRDADRIEQLAAEPNCDTADPELVHTWAGIAQHDLLGLSETARRRLDAAQARMARLEQVRAVALETPPADERLLSVVTRVDPQGDLRGIDIAPGRTLGSRVEAAKGRIALRNAVQSRIAECAGREPTLDGEGAIASAWRAAEQARREAPALFATVAARAGQACLRVDCHGELMSALSEQHGGRVDAVWNRHGGDLRDFAPVQDLRSRVEELLSRYDEFRTLLKQAERRSDDAELIANAERLAAGLELKDAGEPRADLNDRSLSQTVAAARARSEARRRLAEMTGSALDPARLRSELARIADALPPHHEIELLGDDDVVAQLADAATAAACEEGLRRAVAARDLAAFMHLWDEAWHPLLPRTAALVPAAQAMAADVMANVSIQRASMSRDGDNRVRLSWRWLFGPQDHNRDGQGVSEFLTIALRDRRPPDTLQDAEQVITVFRRGEEQDGSVELNYDGDRASVGLFAGCLVAGKPIYSARSFPVAEPKCKLIYRFHASGFRDPDDWLQLRSPSHSFWTPPLHIVHERSGAVISVLNRQHVRVENGHSIDLAQLRASSYDSGWLFRSLQRLMGNQWLCYQLELEDPSDADWIEIIHPSATADRQLSFIWREQAASPSVAQA